MTSSSEPTEQAAIDALVGWITAIAQAIDEANERTTQAAADVEPAAA